MSRFSLRFGAKPDERFSTTAADGLVGRTTEVVFQGERRRVRIVGAHVVDDGLGLELDLEQGPKPTRTRPARGDLDPCARKIAFSSESAVKDELARIIKRAMLGDRRRARHVETGYYHCPTCRRWHLSSRPWNVNVRK